MKRYSIQVAGGTAYIVATSTVTSPFYSGPRKTQTVVGSVPLSTLRAAS